MNLNCFIRRASVATITLVFGTAATAGTHWSFGLSLPGLLEPPDPVYHVPPPAYVVVPGPVYAAPAPLLFYSPAPPYRPPATSLRIEHERYFHDHDDDDDDDDDRD